MTKSKGHEFKKRSKKTSQRSLKANESNSSSDSDKNFNIPKKFLHIFKAAGGKVEEVKED